jgi:hypothetical protein
MSTTAIYCRISLDLHRDRLGVTRQEFECRELADRLGLLVGGVFVDNDISAFKGTHRPAWDELNVRIADREFETLIAWHPDRLTCHPIQLEALVDLLESTKTKVFTVTAGEYDLGTATGRLRGSVDCRTGSGAAVVGARAVQPPPMSLVGQLHSERDQVLEDVSDLLVLMIVRIAFGHRGCIIALGGDVLAGLGAWRPLGLWG